MTGSSNSRDKIRAVTSDDLEMLLKWRNNPTVRKHMFTQHEITEDEHQRWFERSLKDNYKHLLVFENVGIPRGFVQFSQLNTSLVADWGFYTDPEAPKGTGKHLGKMSLDYAFEQLQLHKVCGHALAYNERSIQFHRSLGFKEEGILREQHYDGRNYHNVHCFGLLRSEWQPGK